MAKNVFQKFVSYRYTILFSAIVILLGIMPLMERRESIWMPLFILVLILGVLATLELPKAVFRICVGMGILASFVHLASHILHISLEKGEQPFVFLAIALAVYAVFLAISVTAMIQKIFSQTQVTLDTIRGGIAVYFLLGIWWAFLYRLVLHFDPHAISMSNYQGDFSTILYFSFTTLTTLGYGDILPVTWQARSMTIMESTTGQIYMTVLIARLVGLHLTSAGESK